MKLSYFDLRYGMYIKAKHGRIVWQVFAVCCDRIIYKSVTTKSIRVLKRLKHQHKVFTEINIKLETQWDFCPF